MMRLDLSLLAHAYVLGAAFPARSPEFVDPVLSNFVDAVDRSERPVADVLSDLLRVNADRLHELTPEGAMSFARGLAAAHGCVSVEGGNPTLLLPKLASEGADLVFRAAKSPAQEVGGALVWRGVAAQDALGAILSGEGPQAERLSDAFALWCTMMTHVSWASGADSEILVQRTRDDAIVPNKERVSDSGYDLTLLYVKKTLGPTTLFGTGIIVEPPHGWYLDVVPRSSIIKRGYTLANNVGIIDRSYRGEIFVPLLKVDPNAPELELPARVAQLIPRPIVHFPVREQMELSSTDRGAGGFGSTGK